MERNVELFQHLALAGDESLAHPALAIGRLEYPELDLSKYIDWFERRGESLSSKFGATKGVLDRIQILNRFVYEEEKFAPNSRDYYDPKNSYLNDVIERKLGIPITLAVIYMELARYLGLELKGIGFPGHFLIGNWQDMAFYIDAFHFGEILLRADCEERFLQATGGSVQFNDVFLKPASKVEVLARMLANLKNIFVEQRRFDRAVETLNWTIAIQPKVPLHFRDRGILLARIECPDAALKDLEHYLKHSMGATERQQVEDLVVALRNNRKTIH